MKTPLGTRIQGLEKTVIENLKATQLVEHPHFYHGNLTKKEEPLTLQYKVTETYRSRGEYYDPLFEIFPLIDILTKQYAGTIEISTKYDEATQIRTLRLRIEHCPSQDIMQFKHDVLLQLNQVVCDYLKKTKKKPVEK